MNLYWSYKLQEGLAIPCDTITPILHLEEGLGFEPRDPLGSTVFRTVAFIHSASLPFFISLLVLNSLYHVKVMRNIDQRLTGFEPAPTAWKAVMLPLNTIDAYMVETPGLEPGNPEGTDLQSVAVAAVPYLHLW